jgi:hypothetical protein
MAQKPFMWVEAERKLLTQSQINSSGLIFLMTQK